MNNSNTEKDEITRLKQIYKSQGRLTEPMIKRVNKLSSSLYPKGYEKEKTIYYDSKGGKRKTRRMKKSSTRKRRSSKTKCKRY
jgi:hypothetical protein